MRSLVSLLLLFHFLAIFFFFAQCALDTRPAFFLFFFLFRVLNQGFSSRVAKSIWVGLVHSHVSKVESNPCLLFCCHFKLPIIDEFAKTQTDRKWKGARLLLQLKRQYLYIYMLVSFPFPFWLSQSPGPVNILLVHFFALGLGLPFGLCVCVLNYANQMAHIDVGCNIIAAIQQFNSLSKCNQRFKEGPSLVLPSIQFKESK